MDNQTKLAMLAVLEGLTIEEMLAEATLDSMVNGVAKGICSDPICNYTNDVEPDQDKGYCEKCGGQTVTSCMVLAGMI
jgi:hypothetical protein